MIVWKNELSHIYLKYTAYGVDKSELKNLVNLIQYVHNDKVFSCHLHYTGQQKKCQSLKISYFPNFGSLIPNPTINFKFMEPILQCFQFCGFFD